jgi:hypothetical protein
MEGELKAGGRAADAACLSIYQGRSSLPSVTHHRRRFWRGLHPPPPPSHSSMACDVICLSVVDPRPFSAQLLNGHAQEVPRGLI